MEITIELSEEIIKLFMKTKNCSKEEAVSKLRENIQMIADTFPKIWSLTKTIGRVDLGKAVDSVKKS